MCVFTGGGLIKSGGPSPTNPLVASAVGITLGIVMGLAAMVVSIYCVVRRRLSHRRRRPLNGGSASDYFGRFDFTSGPLSLLPPAYSATLLLGPSLPPPYDDNKADDEPPKYESFEMTSMQTADSNENNARQREDSM